MTSTVDGEIHDRRRSREVHHRRRAYEAHPVIREPSPMYATARPQTIVTTINSCSRAKSPNEHIGMQTGGQLPVQPAIARRIGAVHAGRGGNVFQLHGFKRHTRTHTVPHTHTHQEPSNKIAKHGGAKPGVHWSATPLQMNIIFRLDPKDLAPSSNARL